jgi:hypothetical protein
MTGWDVDGFRIKEAHMRQPGIVIKKYSIIEIKKYGILLRSH